MKRVDIKVDNIEKGLTEIDLYSVSVEDETLLYNLLIDLLHIMRTQHEKDYEKS